MVPRMQDLLSLAFKLLRKEPLTTVQNFAHSDHPARSYEVGPEALPDVFDCIDAQSVNLKGIDKLADPCVQYLHYARALGV
jgi:hypothetical protein